MVSIIYFVLKAKQKKAIEQFYKKNLLAFLPAYVARNAS